MRPANRYTSPFGGVVKPTVDFATKASFVARRNKSFSNDSFRIINTLADDSDAGELTMQNCEIA